MLVPIVALRRSSAATQQTGHPTDEEWAAAPALPLSLWSGAPDPLAARHGPSTARLLWDDEALHLRGEIAFETLHLDPEPPPLSSSGDGKRHGLWDYDVVELFCARGPLRDGEPLPYGEVEGAPGGQRLDYWIEEPRRRVDREWRSGARVRGALDRPVVGRFLVEIALPWAGLGVRVSEGVELAANVYAAQGPPGARRFLALSPTETAVPDFHVPARFARLRLG